MNVERFIGNEGDDEKDQLQGKVWQCDGHELLIVPFWWWLNVDDAVVSLFQVGNWNKVQRAGWLERGSFQGTDRHFEVDTVKNLINSMNTLRPIQCQSIKPHDALETHSIHDNP